MVSREHHAARHRRRDDGHRTTRRRLLPAVVPLVVVVLVAACTDAPPEPVRPTRPLRADVTVTLGEREVVLDAGADGFPSASYFTYVWQGRTYGVLSGGGRHVRYAEPLAVPLSGGEPMGGLEPGPAELDRRAATLDGVYADDGGTLHGIYQAEHPLRDPADDSEPHRSLAYATSTDGGRTWTKPDYPDNQVVTAPPGGEAGEASLLVVGDDLYLFFAQNRQTTMARAPKADGGRPGSWRKWYCPTPEEREQAGVAEPKPGEKPYCDFLEPGLGGKATPIPGMKGNPFVTRNDLLQAYLAVDDTVREGRVAFRTSEDLQTWLGVANEPTLPEPEPGWGYLAASQVADDGSSSTTGLTFWLYYLEWNEPASATRLLVRQRVSLTPVGP